MAAEMDAVCGFEAVSALFAKRPADALRLFYAEAMRGRVGPFCAALARARRPYRLLPPDELARAAGTPRHGGVVAVARPRPVPPFDPARPPLVPLLLVLDGVGNPHNLGAIARSAAFFGAGALLLREGAGQAMPSGAAYRTAEGGLEHLELRRAGDLAACLRALRPGYRTVATALTGDAVPVAGLPRDRPIALVLGNEERGVSRETLAACESRVRIPGSGRVQSLNVAQAAAVLLHALA
jgi:RNA methyltransferase, TrmH family